MTPELVKASSVGGVTTLTLNDPPANAYTYEMFQQLDAAILAARMDDGVHVIVLRGAGEKFFCAGANINMLDAVTPTFKYYFCLHANETLLRLEQTPKLVIAAIGGHCVGGGLEIAMACDLRVARRGAGKLGLPEVSLGVLPGTGGTQRLVRIVGKSKAISLMAKGALFDADEALRLGVVDEVFDGQAPGSATASATGPSGPGDFWAQVGAYARQFVPPGKASKAVGRIKRAVQSGAEVGLADGLALERELQQQLFQSEDAREGIGAYVGKRTPSFTGK